MMETGINKRANKRDQASARPSVKCTRRAAFTLVEIMIVIAILALLAVIAVPAFMRARQRSLAGRMRNELRLIESAVDQYAIETNKNAGDTVAVVDWTNY